MGDYLKIVKSWDEHDKRVSTCRLHKDLYSCYMNSESFRDYKKLTGSDRTTLGTKIKIGDEVRYIAIIGLRMGMLFYLEKEKKKIIDKIIEQKVNLFITEVKVEFNRTTILYKTYIYLAASLKSLFIKKQSCQLVNHSLSDGIILFVNKHYKTSIDRTDKYLFYKHNNLIG